MSGFALLEMGLPLFEGLDAAALRPLDLNWSEQAFQSGNIVFSQDDESCDVFFLLGGALIALYWTQEGREVVFTRFPRGSCIGELSALDGQPRSLAVFAKTDAKVLRLERASFLRLMDEVPAFRTRVIKELAGRIRRLTSKMIEVTTYSVEQRLCAYLIRLALESDRFVAGGVIEGAPTHAEIASSIGANREMVSRTISNLSKRGIIKPGRQRIEVILPEALSESI